MAGEWPQMAQAVGSVGSAVISFFGFAVVIWQIRINTKTMRQSNHIAIYSNSTEIWKIIAEKSHLRPYFYDGKTMSSDDENRDMVFSVAELIADSFEYILIDKKLIAPEIWIPWENYMKKIYKKSSAFREFIEINQDQYSDKLVRLLMDSLHEQ